MSEKTEKIVVIVAVGILSVSVTWGWIWFNSPKEWIVEKSSIKDVLYFEEGRNQDNKCIVLDSNMEGFTIIESEYICLRQWKYKGGGFYLTNATEIDFAKLVFYDLLTRKKIREVDLTEIIRKYLEDGFEWDGDYSIYVLDDKAYAACCLIKFDENATPDTTVITIYINLYTGEVEESKGYYEGIDSLKELEVLNERKREYNQSMYMINSSDEIGLLKANRFTEEESGNLGVRAIDETGIYICLKAGMIPKENERLYAEFPGLKEYKGKEDDVVYIFIDSYLTAEEIMSMLLEEGQEISFEGCVLSAELSIDGQEHNINSFEDYYQWRDFDKY